MSGVVWEEEELDFLMKNFGRFNNYQLAARITVIHGNLRTPSAIRGKLSYLSLRRSLAKKRKIRGKHHLFAVAICDCCSGPIEIVDQFCPHCTYTDYTDYLKKKAFSYPDQKQEYAPDIDGLLSKNIVFCLNHGEPVWISQAFPWVVK